MTSNSHNHLSQSVAHSHSQQSSDPASSAPSSRFNSFSLPAHRSQHGFPEPLHLAANPHVPASSAAAAGVPQSSFASQLPLDTHSRRQSLSSGPARHGQPHQQQPPPLQQQRASQLLSTQPITPSSSGYGGSAGEPAGGGGGSSGAVSSLTIGQINLLLTTTNDRNYEARRKEIMKLTESPEVNARLLQKLITDNYAFIVSPASTSSSRSQDQGYRLLGDILKAIANAPHKAKTAFADVITPDGVANSEAAKVFRDFNLAVFFNHYQLDSLQRSILAVGFKTHPKEDLRNKAHDILARSFGSMLEILGNPSKHTELTPEGIAFFLRQLLSEPVPSFLVKEARLKLSHVARSRYKNMPLPPEIFNVTEPVEHLRQQASLVQVLEQCGPECVANLDDCREMLQQNWNMQVTEAEVADVLVCMATSNNPGAWNSSNLIATLQDAGNISQDFDWMQVMEGLDREDLVIEQPTAFVVILRAFQQGTKGQNFPIDRLWSGHWSHPQTQWSMLKGYLSSEDVDISKLPEARKVFTSVDFANASSGVKSLATVFENNKLISLAAVETLFYLSLIPDVPVEVNDPARAELDKAAKYAPELLLCGALMIPPPRADPLESVIDTLMFTFFDGHTSHQLVFWRLWQIDKSRVVRKFVDYYNQDPMRLTRILDISQDLRCLSDLLEAQNPMFVLDVASTAARREYLNLDKWLVEMIEKYGGDGFAMQCYQFVKMKADHEYAVHREGVKPVMVNLRVGVVYSFLTVLDKATGAYAMNPVLHDVATIAQRSCIQAYPRLINFGNGFDQIILQNNAESNTFSHGIDAEMQQHYKALYAQDVEVRDLVNHLEKLKYSPAPGDQDLFACMIHGLFDEYPCYPDYPLQALATTAVLFGSVIRYKLVDHIPLRVALQMVWQAVREHAPETPMYKFGLQALLQFSTRLPEWKAYCALLLNVQGLQGTEIWAIAQDVAAGRVERSVDGSINGSVDHESHEESHESSRGLPNGSTQSPAPPAMQSFQSIQADPPLESIYYEDPDEEVQDKVLFALNNVSQSNLESKLGEIENYLQESHHQWFADYLVLMRAKLESNNHALYQNLVERLGHKGLMQEVLRQTYIHIVKTINAESIFNSQMERGHLKNLAMWLGDLTIAKDKPIKFKNIAFKELLIEGYETERLTVVLPFTCQLLMRAKNSTIFKPPNPWLMAIIRLLKELYDNAGLKLNLKFEIEVLCRELGLDIDKVKPATDLQESKENREAAKEGLEEDNLAMETLAMQQQQQQRMAADYTSEIPSTFLENITITPMVHDPNLRKLLIETIGRTVHEILGPVVERSVTIATISSNQLIIKDFATELDENKMRTAAIGMAQRLAGNLALVTCKDPLRMSMTNNIRTALQNAGYNEQALSDQTVTLIVNDNLEFACRTVEKAAQEQATPQIDEALRPAYIERRQWRRSGSLQQFLAAGASSIALNLPDAFNLKAGGMSPQQLKVYEDFARPSVNGSMAMEQARGPIPETLPLEYLAGSLQGTPGISEGPQAEQQRLVEAPPVGPQQQIPVINQYFEKISGWIDDLRKLSRDSQGGDLSTTPDRHRIFQLIEMVITAIAQFAQVTKERDSLCTKTAAVLCNQLYNGTQNMLEIESSIFLLKKVCDFSPQTAKEVLAYLAQDKNAQALNIPVTIVLLQSHLLPISQLDASLAKLIDKREPEALGFLAQLLNDIQTDPPVAYRTDFTTSFEAVAEWIREDPSNEAAKSLWNDFQGTEDNAALEERDRRDQIRHIFSEWVQLCQNVSTTDKSYAAFIIQLHEARIVGERDSCAEFFRTCLDICCVDYETTRHSGASLASSCYISVDALAKIVMLLVKYQNEDVTGGLFGKVEYLNATLALVAFVFNHHYETHKNNVCEKVFFRFFSSLLYENHLAEAQLAPYAERILCTFAECFMLLQPMFFPVFTFHWVTLISHRYFMAKLLRTEKGKAMFLQLLQTHMEYIGVTLRNPQGAAKILYKGSLRLLLVLHHDFPEFLAENYASICEVIPMQCTQLRNLILSALPASVLECPDPFTDGMMSQIDMQPESRTVPVVRADTVGPLRRSGIKEPVDEILSSGEVNDGIIDAIVERLAAGQKPDGSSVLAVHQVIIIRALNSLVMYVGMDACETAISNGLSIFNPDSPHVKLLARVALKLDTVLRYFYLSAIANHLRYPNAHTAFFAHFILHLFDHDDQSGSDEVKEQITRVLLERLYVHRPHPWGLIVTTLDLFKNGQHGFWDLPFVRASPEVSTIPEMLSTLSK